MNDTQQRAWAAIQTRLRHGQSIEVALRDCRMLGVPVVGVRRLHLGKQDDPQYNTVEDVTHLYLEPES